MSASNSVADFGCLDALSTQRLCRLRLHRLLPCVRGPAEDTMDASTSSATDSVYEDESQETLAYIVAHADDCAIIGRL